MRVVAKATDTRRGGGYVWESTRLECTHVSGGGADVYVRLNERRPTMVDGSSAARMGATRCRCGTEVLEVCCDPPELLAEAMAAVAFAAMPGVPVVQNKMWNVARARSLDWMPQMCGAAGAVLR